LQKVRSLQAAWPHEPGKFQKLFSPPFCFCSVRSFCLFLSQMGFSQPSKYLSLREGGGGDTRGQSIYFLFGYFSNIPCTCSRRRLARMKSDTDQNNGLSSRSAESKICEKIAYLKR
jgi:hypothetical protein